MAANNPGFPPQPAQPATIPPAPSPLAAAYYPFCDSYTPCLALVEADREASHYSDYPSPLYAKRATITIKDITATVPFDVRFLRAYTDFEGADNFVAYVAFVRDLAAAKSAADEVTIKFKLTAAR